MANAKKSYKQLQEGAAVSTQEMARAEALFMSIGDGAIATDESGRIERIN